MGVLYTMGQLIRCNILNFSQNLEPTLPIMQHSHSVTSVDAPYQMTLMALQLFAVFFVLFLHMQQTAEHL